MMHPAGGRTTRGGGWHGPRLGGLRLLALVCLLGVGGLLAAARTASAQDNLINRISNERMRTFEERLTGDLNTALGRYVSRHQYVLAVKVIWNPDIVPVIENPQLAPAQKKLPGFPIFVRSPDSPATEEGIPPFVRLEVKVLIDETLPEYYERFVRKIVPIVARMDFNRGDQVVVLKETFPVLPQEEVPPPTLPEKELMQQLGTTPPPGQLPPTMPVPVPSAGVFAPQTATSPAEAAQMAYDEGRLTDALRIAQSGFQRASTNRERGFFLGMEGSIYYTQGNVEAARLSWRRAVTFDPTNMEVHEVLNFLETQGGGPQ